MGPNDITIGNTDRVLIAGRSGSGKSTLARAMFYSGHSLVVVDPKHEEELAASLTVYTPAEFRRAYPQRCRRIVFRPDPRDGRGRDVGEVLARVLQYGNCRVLLHETVYYASSSWVLPELRQVAKVGRSRGVPLVMLAQRPVGLHNDIIAEAEHVFEFDLAMPGDREKLAGLGWPGLLERPAHPHGFLYAGPSTGGAVVACDPVPVRAMPGGPAPR